MKIKRWSTSGGVTDVLPSSSTVPPPALTSSVPLTVGDAVDNAKHGTESESDGSVSNEIGDQLTQLLPTRGPERLFSIFNSSFDADQSRSYADYMHLSIQSQFNR